MSTTVNPPLPRPLQVIWNSDGFHYGDASQLDMAPAETTAGYDSSRRQFMLAKAGAWQYPSVREVQDFLRAAATAAIPSHSESPEPCLVLVSDDGARADYRKLGPLARDGVPFTLSLVRDFLTGSKRHDCMTPAEVNEMVGWGCEVAAHGLTHKALLKMDYAQMHEEVEGSVSYLREQGWPVSAFIYPFGSCNSKARQLLWDLGLSGCVTHGGPVGRMMDRTAITRVAFGSFLRPGLATDAQYIALVDRVRKQRGMLVFMLHPEEPRHNAEQQRALVKVIEYARRTGMLITTLTDAVARHGPLWQERPRSLWQWQLTRDGRLRRMWTGGHPAQAGWKWLSGDSPLREVIWNARGEMRKLIGRQGKYEV